MKHLKELKINEDYNEASNYKERLLQIYGEVISNIENMSEEECAQFHQETIQHFNKIFYKLPQYNKVAFGGNPK
jgi:hypothetical protein